MEKDGLSNWANEKFLLVRAQYEFFDWFDGILISSEVKLAKPDPRIYAVMLEQIGEPAERCLFIDDSLKNVEAAKALGFQTIHYTSPEALATTLAESGVLRSNE